MEVGQGNTTGCVRSLLRAFWQLSDTSKWFWGLTLYYALTSLVWHAIDQRPPRWDEAHYLTMAQHSYQALQRGDLLGALSFKGVTSTKSGLVCFLSALTYFVVGDSEFTATFLLNLSSLMVIFWSLPRISRDLTGRTSPGGIACLLFCNLPTVIIWSRYYQADLPMTAAVCCTVWLCLALDRTDYQGKARAALLGLAVLVGMGAKHLYVAFVFAPLALALGRALVRSAWPLRIRFRGRWYFLGCLAGGVALGSLYHVLNFHVIEEQLRRFHDYHLAGGGTDSGQPPSPWLCLGQLFTISSLPRPLLLAIGVLAGAWLTWWTRRTLYVLASVVGGCATVIAVTSWPQSYYFLPLAPLAFLVGCCVLVLPLPGPAGLARTLGWARGALIVLLPVLLVRSHSKDLLGTRNLFRVAARAPAILLSASRLTGNPLAATAYWHNGTPDGNVATLPYPHHWPADEILDVVARKISARGPHPGGKYTVGHFTQLHEWMSQEFLHFKAEQKRLLDVLVVVPIPVEPPWAPTTPEALTGYDFLVVKTGAICKADFLSCAAVVQMQGFVNSLADNNYRRLREAGFVLLRSYDLPDGSEGTVWMSPRLCCRSTPCWTSSMGPESAARLRPGSPPFRSGTSAGRCCSSPLYAAEFPRCAGHWRRRIGEIE